MRRPAGPETTQDLLNRRHSLSAIYLDPAALGIGKHRLKSDVRPSSPDFARAGTQPAGLPASVCLPPVDRSPIDSCREATCIGLFVRPASRRPALPASSATR